MIDFESENFKFFRAKSVIGKQWVGLPPREWASSFLEDTAVLASLPTDPVSRKELLNMRNGTESSEVCFLACMAWGGMFPWHGKTAWNERHKFISILDALRAGDGMDRADAYERFNGTRVRGLGPAFFTKLIHFFNSQPGYILDQWTAKSINLLAVAPFISLDRVHKSEDRHTVPRRNGRDVYEKYCSCVELIACRLQTDPASVEERLFFESEWRQRVRREFSR